MAWLASLLPLGGVPPEDVTDGGAGGPRAPPAWLAAGAAAERAARWAPAHLGAGAEPPGGAAEASLTAVGVGPAREGGGVAVVTAGGATAQYERCAAPGSASAGARAADPVRVACAAVDGRAGVALVGVAEPAPRALLAVAKLRLGAKPLRPAKADSAVDLPAPPSACLLNCTSSLAAVLCAGHALIWRVERKKDGRSGLTRVAKLRLSARPVGGAFSTVLPTTLHVVLASGKALRFEVGAAGVSENESPCALARGAAARCASFEGSDARCVLGGVGGALAVRQLPSAPEGLPPAADSIAPGGVDVDALAWHPSCGALLVALANGRVLLLTCALRPLRLVTLDESVLADGVRCGGMVSSLTWVRPPADGRDKPAEAVVALAAGVPLVLQLTPGLLSTGELAAQLLHDGDHAAAVETAEAAASEAERVSELAFLADALCRNPAAVAPDGAPANAALRRACSALVKLATEPAELECTGPALAALRRCGLAAAAEGWLDEAYAIAHAADDRAALEDMYCAAFQAGEDRLAEAALERASECASPPAAEPLPSPSQLYKLAELERRVRALTSSQPTGEIGLA